MKKILILLFLATAFICTVDAMHPGAIGYIARSRPHSGVKVLTLN